MGPASLHSRGGSCQLESVESFSPSHLKISQHATRGKAKYQEQPRDAKITPAQTWQSRAHCCPRAICRAERRGGTSQPRWRSMRNSLQNSLRTHPKRALLHVLVIYQRHRIQGTASRGLQGRDSGASRGLTRPDASRPGKAKGRSRGEEGADGEQHSRHLVVPDSVMGARMAAHTCLRTHRYHACSHHLRTPWPSGWDESSAAAGFL